MPSPRSFWRSPAAQPSGDRLTDAPALRTLFEQNHGRICRLLRRLGVQPAQIDDAAQEVFWVAARRLEEIQPGRESAFLYGVALRVASDDRRRRKADPELSDREALARIVDPLPTPEELLDQKKTRALLDLALARMPHELRTMLVLFELEGLEVREIAAIEGVPLGTASSRLRRAREEFLAIARRLRTALAAGVVPR